MVVVTMMHILIGIATSTVGRIALEIDTTAFASGIESCSISAILVSSTASDSFFASAGALIGTACAADDVEGIIIRCGISAVGACGGHGSVDLFIIGFVVAPVHFGGGVEGRIFVLGLDNDVFLVAAASASFDTSARERRGNRSSCHNIDGRNSSCNGITPSFAPTAPTTAAITILIIPAATRMGMHVRTSGEIDHCVRIGFG
mmetsp:Transcript_25991/g.53767  ORF Transcript_25991/g.53767 Transcript_25991/m.53767 type:complete len:203 (-) Transcript_25991:495-1103(-)